MVLQLNSILFLSLCMNSVKQLVIQSFFVVVVVLVNGNFLIHFFLAEKVFINIVNRIIHFLKFWKV